MNPNLSKLLTCVAAVGVVACGGPVDDRDLVMSSNEAALKSSKPSSSSTDAGTSASPAATLVTTNQYDPGVVPPLVTRFAITSTYDVYVAAQLSNLTGSHTLTTQFLAPGGSLWADNSVNFATTSTATSGQVQASKVGSSWQTWSSVPVAGTAIQTYGLSGTWTASVYLDNEATPLASTTFTLY